MTSLEDKAALYQRLIAEVKADLQQAEETQKSTQEDAVHAEAKQEGDKDTRAIETQYLARGLAMRVEELQEAVGVLQAVAPRSFDDDEPIALTALVTLEDEDGAERRYLLAGAAGGWSLGAVKVVTSKSPVGRALLGKRLGDEVEIRTPKGPRTWEIVELI